MFYHNPRIECGQKNKKYCAVHKKNIDSMANVFIVAVIEVIWPFDATQ